LDLAVFVIVLAAAAMHAGCNAVVKSAGDPFASVTLVSLFSGLAALPLLPIFGWPRPEAWIWLWVSVAIHVVYWFMVVGAYRTGDMAQVYPIMRGAAPLATAVASALLIGEVLSPTGFAAVVLLSAGVCLMSFKGGRLGTIEGRAVAFALGSAACTCAYSLADGTGARLNGSGVGYTLWMFVLNMIVMQAIALVRHGTAIHRGLIHSWRPAAIGGAMALVGYAIAVWAMTKAPIALVAALRETSVLFGALIATAVLREPMTRWRGVAACLVVTGVVLLRVA